MGHLETKIPLLRVRVSRAGNFRQFWKAIFFGGQGRLESNVARLGGNLAAFALEFAHEAGQGFDGLGLDRIVKGNAHAAYGAMARSADQACRSSLLAEFLFGGFVGMGRGGLSVRASDTKDDVHL